MMRTSIGRRLVNDGLKTPTWQLVLGVGLCTFWLVRSITRNGSLSAFDRWDVWTWVEVTSFAVGALVFLVAIIVKRRWTHS
jgi:hypothetical protein